MSPQQLRTRLVVLYGGESAEHDVSTVTAAYALRAIDPERYAIEPVAIGKDGTWRAATTTRAQFAAGELPDRLVVDGDPVAPLATLRGAGPEASVVLPLLHGPRGEDGTVQGLCELAGVAYMGPGVLGSALAMDKAKCKEVLAFAGIPQARWVTLREPEVDEGTPERLIEELGLPVFVKPANMGSSVGVAKARDREELAAALATALQYDEWLVVEENIVGREIEVALLGDRELRASVPGEIVPGADFYDYEDKYGADSAELRIPAPLSDAERAEIQRLAVAAGAALRVEGLSRADFFLTEDRGFLCNELNTIPGFTPVSMYPMLWQASGLEYPALIDELVRLALTRQARAAAHRSGAQ